LQTSSLKNEQKKKEMRGERATERIAVAAEEKIDELNLQMESSN
jgi:hypothetical protein